MILKTRKAWIPAFAGMTFEQARQSASVKSASRQNGFPPPSAPCLDVLPVQTGIQVLKTRKTWIPAFAGMTQRTAGFLSGSDLAMRKFKPD
jgi:hypothetical protein